MMHKDSLSQGLLLENILVYEPLHEKTNNLNMRKQRRRSAM